MNGVHDMGGMHGMGPIEPEPNEPVFHEPWEGRVYALARRTPPVGQRPQLGKRPVSGSKASPPPTICACRTTRSGSLGLLACYSRATSSRRRSSRAVRPIPTCRGRHCFQRRRMRRPGPRGSTSR